MSDMKRAAIGGLALIALTACGNTDASSDDTKAEPEPTVTSSSAAPQLSLRESCPQIEAGLPEDTILSEPAEWRAYAEQLAQIAAQGDVETQNAVDLLQTEVGTLAMDPERGMETIDASIALLDALDTVAKRCKAVGSSALQ